MATPEPVDTAKPKVEPVKPTVPDPKLKEPTETSAKEPVKEPEPGVEPGAVEAGQEVEGKGPDGKSAPSWKLVQTYKAEAKALKKELAELRNGSGNLPQLQEQLKSANARAEAAEKRSKELSDHMQFVDYSHSDEFVTKYQKPY